MKTLTRSLLAGIVAALTITPLFAQQPEINRPDLIVIISIDQFPYYYLPRFAPFFTTGGFNRFLKGGADFTNALYPYSTTFTGPGHAAIGTGWTPSHTGIVANNWYDRQSGKAVYCVDDARVVGGFSPMNLDSDSLGDRLQEKYTAAKVYSVSIKDRAAILMGGRKATAAYWLDEKKGGFTSSSYYVRGIDQALLDDYNRTIPGYVAAHTVWDLSGYIPAADLDKVTHDPERLRQYKRSHEGLGVSFPHPIKGLDALVYTPFGNDLVLGLARRVLETENIGTADHHPDILFISLSSQDYLGHDFGPDSLEAADSVVRIDRQLADFFDFLDHNFHDRVTVALTADHGVQSIPEVAKDLGRDAGRVDMRRTKSMKTFGEFGTARKQIEELTAKELGVKVSNATPADDSLILYFDEPAIYLNWPRVRALHLDGERVKRAMADAVRQVHGVSAVFTNTQLIEDEDKPLGSDIESAVERSFRADRDGDIVITLKAGYIWAYAATTHGQPVEADQHVPVMFWGAGVKPGVYDMRVAPIDIARSVGFELGVDAGDPEEAHVLPCFTTGTSTSTPVGATITLTTTPQVRFSDPTRTDLANAITTALNDIGSGNATVMIGAQVSDDARAAVSATRRTIDVKNATEEQRQLPPGIVRLDIATISDGHATVRLWTGPIAKPEPGKAALDCGRGTTFEMEKSATGAWVVKSRGVAVC